MNHDDVESSGLTARVIRDTAGWQPLEAQWRALWAASDTASPPLRWEWAWEWWRLYGEEYGDPQGGLWIIAVERGSSLVAVLPLYLAKRGSEPFAPRALRFISSGEARSDETCAQNLDMLCAPGEEAACRAAIASILRTFKPKRWDQVFLQPLSPSSPLLDWRGDVKDVRYGLPVRHVRSYFANLEHGFEAYLERLSANSRAQARRLIRSLNAEGVTFELATDEATAEAFFDQLVTLHQQRWTSAGEPGVFASPRFTSFHRALIRQLVPSGGAVLARLAYRGQPLAIVHGYLARGRFDQYLAGTSLDTDIPIKSPGIAAHLKLKSVLAERNVHLIHAPVEDEEGVELHAVLARLARTPDQRPLRGAREARGISLPRRVQARRD
jgi:CelD/BcsL family acetyltransferase involved in cellulose biosynthesis